MAAAMVVPSCCLWVLTYLLILRRGLLDQAIGVPLPALAASITWEILFGIVRPTTPLPSFAVPAWLVVDAAILWLLLRFGAVPGTSKEARRQRLLYYAQVGAALSMGFALNAAFAVLTDDRDGIRSAYVVNAVMSLSFALRVLRYSDVRGQSMYIALGKLFGSSIVIPRSVALHSHVVWLRGVMAIMVASDIAYALLLYARQRDQGLRPFARI